MDSACPLSGLSADFGVLRPAEHRSAGNIAKNAWQTSCAHDEGGKPCNHCICGSFGVVSRMPNGLVFRAILWQPLPSTVRIRTFGWCFSLRSNNRKQPHLRGPVHPNCQTFLKFPLLRNSREKFLTSMAFFYRIYGSAYADILAPGATGGQKSKRRCKQHG